MLFVSVQKLILSMQILATVIFYYQLFCTFQGIQTFFVHPLDFGVFRL